MNKFRFFLTLFLLSALFRFCTEKESKQEQLKHCFSEGNFNEARIIIDEFVRKNHIDKRETIFDIHTGIENGILILTGETDNSTLKTRFIAELSTLEFKEKINLLPDSTVGDKTFGLINLSVANLRTEPIKIKEIAERFTGRPYLWGGTSARAMDCSGFVKTIYFMNGIILARDASLQTRHGQLIETLANFDNLEIGDLLFFGKKEEAGTSEKITHVALSLSGTEYIHASGRIKKNSFNPESEIFSEYRKNSFVSARRIVGSEDKRGIQQLKEHPWY